VRGDEVVFVADDDVWLAALAGGRAQRLTSDHAPVGNPRLSPDGNRIAFTSARAGAPDTYVFDRTSGVTSRLTWWGRGIVVGWRDDGRVAVTSGHQEVTPVLTRLYLVGLDGAVEKLPVGPAGAGAWSDDGRCALTTPNIRETPFWKRYRGGAASRLWIEQPDGGWWQAVTDELAGMNGPGWYGDRVLFCSDLGAGRAVITDPVAQAQLYSVDAAGADLRQHTHHDAAAGYVRDPRTDGRTVVYHARGHLYAMAGLDADPRPIEVDLGVAAPAPLTVDPTDNLEVLVPDHAGVGSLANWRGAMYYLTHRAGPARALCARDGVRTREPVVLGATGACAFVTDADGEDAIEVAQVDGLGEHRRLATGRLGYVLHLAASPDGAYVAVSSHDGAVRLVVVGDGTVRDLDRSGAGEVDGLAWSPDSRYLVWSAPLTSGAEPRAQLRCAEVSAPGDPAWVALTAGGFADTEPVFTRDGKHLAWLSARTFDPRYNEHGFALSFADSVRPWLAPLSAGEPAPFGVSADGWPLAKADDSAGSDGASESEAVAGESAPPSCRLDADGGEARAIALPVPSGLYSGLRAVKDGLAWLRDPGAIGELGTTWSGVPGDGPAGLVERFSFETRKAEVLVDKADSFEVSGNGEVLVVRHRDDVSVQGARRIEPDDDDAVVRVDLTRLRRSIDRRAEWRGMFAESGRLMAAHFWREDMDGVNWPGVLERYRPLIDTCLTHSDVVDVLAECAGELNTSHAYVGDESARREIGFLGADVSRVADGWRIDRLLPGESSDPRAWQPLRRAGVDAREGEVIVAVDGRSAMEAPSLGALLEGAAGKPVELVLRRGGTDRRVCVVPLPDEAGLRYHAWVADRVARVAAASGGRLGYVHVPDMAAPGWAQLERMIDEAARREGVIADVRYNAGGHTSSLVIDRLVQKVIGWELARHLDRADPYPLQGMRGPVVLVTNELAGSDGDLVTAAAKRHGLTVVGTRTWGGVVGIDSRYELVDGTAVTQPRYACWLEGSGWGIENHGVEPDIDVPLRPDQWRCEDDLALDAAMAEALRQLERQPAASAPMQPAPRFAAGQAGDHRSAGARSGSAERGLAAAASLG